MSSSPDRGKGKGVAREIIFEVPNTPQPFKDFSDVTLSPIRRDLSNDSMGSPHHLPINLPSLPYSKPIPASRAPSYGEVGTEYNPPTRVTGGGNRVRGHYVSLGDAITDDSRPDFHPENLYAIEGNASSSTLNGKSPDFNKLSPGFGEGNGSYSPGYRSYPPTPNYGTKGNEVDFLKTPSPSLFPRGLPKPPKRHPFSQWYEAPKWKSLVGHTLLCLLAYPFLLIFVMVARRRTLFWTRVVVGIGCGFTGVLLGWSLLRLARRHLEAAGESAVVPYIVG